MIRLFDDRRGRGGGGERRAGRRRKKREDGDYRSTAAETLTARDLLSCIPLLGTIGSRAREVKRRVHPEISS